MALKLNCSKCKSEMQPGLVLDLSYAGIVRSMCVEDQADKKLKTITCRCSNCGFLDSYAK